MIQKMTNKELVIRLTECYYWVNKIEVVISNQYWQHKMKIIPAEIDTYKYIEAVLNNKEAVFFYDFINSDKIWRIFPFIDAIIDYTIILLDKYGDFRYDMDHNDKEFEAFLEARVDSVVMIKGQ
jgi:hypothetical protein